MEKKSKKGTIIACVLLFIIGAAAGFFAGKFFGTPSEEPETEETAQTEEDTKETETETDTEKETETESGIILDSETVITVADRKVTMDEISYYSYELRDYYVSKYGEDALSQQMEDGRTRADHAKDELLKNVATTQVLDIKAAEWELKMDDSLIKEVEKNANDYCNSLKGIADDISMNKKAVYKVFLDEEMANLAGMKILGDIMDELKDDPAFADDAALEKEAQKRYDAYVEKLVSEYEVKTTDVWDEIVIGSLG